MITISKFSNNFREKLISDRRVLHNQQPVLVKTSVAP